MAFDIVVISSEDVTVSGAHAESSAAPTGTTHARLSALTNCRVRTSLTPVAVATDTLIKATDPAVLIRIAVGDKVSALQDSAGGKLNVAFVRASHA